MKKGPHRHKIVETAPSAPENSYARMAVALASQKAAELSDPEHDLGNTRGLGRWFGDAGGMGVESLPLWVGQGSCARGVRFMAGQMGQPMQTPGNDHIECETGEQTVGIFQATVLDTAAGFENLVPDFNLPALTVPADALQCLLGLLHRHAGQQNPLHRSPPLGRIDCTHLNRPERKRLQG